VRSPHRPVDGGADGPDLIGGIIVENPEFASVSGWLTGTDAYEGLSADVVWLNSGGDPLFRGHITAAGQPPVPENLPG
jgi:hypothetical protein